MARQVALLRGINVGKAKRISMADLKALVTKLGFREVSTLLNSGNVIYSAGRVTPEAAAKKIEAAIEKTTGVTSRVQVLTSEDLDAVVAGHKLGGTATNFSRYFVAFANDPADIKKLTPLTKQEWGEEKLVLGERVAYMWCPAGPIESPLSNAAAKILKDGATTRNWATVLKLQALVA